MRFTQRDALPCGLQTQMEILHCVLQNVMPYYEGYEHACNPNEESTTRVTTQWPTTYVTSILVTRNEDPTMRVTRRDALQCGLQACL